MNEARFARNCLAMLQKDPGFYRNFGYYWWGVKRVLKEHYTQDNLYLLGDYEDREASERLATMPRQQMLLEAILEQQENVLYHMGRPRGSTPDGSPYTVFDQDAGF